MKKLILLMDFQIWSIIMRKPRGVKVLMKNSTNTMRKIESFTEMKNYLDEIGLK